MLYHGPLFSHIQAAAEELASQSKSSKGAAAAAGASAEAPSPEITNLGGRARACLGSLRDFAGGEGHPGGGAGSKGSDDVAAMLRAVTVLQQECVEELSRSVGRALGWSLGWALLVQMGFSSGKVSFSSAS